MHQVRSTPAAINGEEQAAGRYGTDGEDATAMRRGRGGGRQRRRSGRVSTSPPAVEVQAIPLRMIL